ncbi:MAG: trehalase, partial [Kiritimatiellales bacterium]|nr:trehalase [Kiritimatiellales bacterium]
QQPSGMVCDVVRFNKARNNRINSKPPLASWAVWAVFQETGDTGFLEEMYPKLLKYHRWWYANRDLDQNGLCEYGSVNDEFKRPGFESGMDHAARFADAQLVKHAAGYSYDQESVDLNAYLWQEKGFLAKMADRLNRSDDAGILRAEAERLRGTILGRFWDDETGYFYDWSLRENKQIQIVGCEGWTPLFTGLATPEQAERVKRMMFDPERFGTGVLLGTLEHGNKLFDPVNGYWRGPIWLDQAYFGIQGLRTYGFNEEADRLTHLLLTGLEGLADSGGAIRENYNPLDGTGLKAHHFSWSAGHLLMLLMDQ